MVVRCTLSPLNIYCYSEQTLIYKILIFQSLDETALTEIASILSVLENIKRNRNDLFVC